jgi:hypothetical protein
MAIKRIHITLFAISLILGLWAYACMKEQIEPTFFEERMVRLNVSSNDIGVVLQMHDCELRLPPGILGHNPNAPETEAVFSITRINIFPKALPPDIDVIRGPFHFGPEGIVFPVSAWLLFDAPFDYNYEDYSIFTFDFSSDSYKCYPITYVNEENRIVGTAVYQLGFFFLGRHSSLHGNTTGESNLGGFELHEYNDQWYPIDGNNWQPVLQNQTGVWEAESNFHLLSLQQFVFEDREIAQFYIDPIKWSIETPPELVSWEPDHRQGLHYIGPAGTFEWRLKIMHREAFQSLSHCKEYSSLISSKVLFPVFPVIITIVKTGQNFPLQHLMVTGKIFCVNTMNGPLILLPVPAIWK